MTREFDEFEIRVLINLYKGAYIGKRHTPLRNAIKGIKKHELRSAKASIKRLIKDRYLNPKITGHDLDVSINPSKLNEIKNIPEFKIEIKDEF